MSRDLRFHPYPESDRGSSVESTPESHPASETGSERPPSGRSRLWVLRKASSPEGGTLVEQTLPFGAKGPRWLQLDDDTVAGRLFPAEAHFPDLVENLESFRNAMAARAYYTRYASAMDDIAKSSLDSGKALCLVLGAEGAVSDASSAVVDRWKLSVNKAMAQMRSFPHPKPAAMSKGPSTLELREVVLNGSVLLFPDAVEGLEDVLWPAILQLALPDSSRDACLATIEDRSLDGSNTFAISRLSPVPPHTTELFSLDWPVHRKYTFSSSFFADGRNDAFRRAVNQKCPRASCAVYLFSLESYALVDRWSDAGVR